MVFDFTFELSCFGDFRRERVRRLFSRYLDYNSLIGVVQFFVGLRVISYG